MTEMTGRRWWVATGLVLLGALAITAPSVGDFGLTFDEPAYRYSQMVSAQWWERLANGEVEAVTEPDALLFYWPYGRHGINFHPPFAGQLNLLSYAIFGGVLKDIPARRMATVIEFSITVSILFGFLARRYGGWVGLVAAGSLLFMPRLFGQAHLIDTDIPGLMLWAMAATAFWKGLNEPRSGRWRAAVGILVGLAFVEKMGAVLVVLPILGWLALTALPRAFRRGSGAAWVDGLLTTGLMLIPLAMAYLEIRRLEVAFLRLQDGPGPSAGRTDLFRDHPATWMPGGILAVPLAVWAVRRLLGLLRRDSRLWGPERPALETWTAILAFGPVVAWLGNPAWWREALPRLAHYYAISTARRGILPDIQIIYAGQIYEYSLPWHNAWVLMAITVPATILVAAVLGLFLAPWRDRLPQFFALNLVTLPIMRMFPTPAHDGVRLFLPTFFFLAAFAGWGAMGLARRWGRAWARPALASAVLLPAAWGLVNIHPYELSYYNSFIGGPLGAWNAGFELSYWYDAFTNDTIADLNKQLPQGAHITFANSLSSPVNVPEDLQSLGVLRGDLRFEVPRDAFPYMWLLTHDSKADCFSRLLYATVPWFKVEPWQLDKARVVTVAHPGSVSRAWALQLMLDKPDDSPPPPPAAPAWVRAYAPFLARLWGDGVTKAAPLRLEETVMDWARDDPDSLRAAAEWIAEHRSAEGSEPASRLMAVIQRYPDRAAKLLRVRPKALPEAVDVLVRWPDRVRSVVLRQGYSDMRPFGGCIDPEM